MTNNCIAPKFDYFNPQTKPPLTHLLTGSLNMNFFKSGSDSEKAKAKEAKEAEKGMSRDLNGHDLRIIAKRYDAAQKKREKEEAKAMKAQEAREKRWNKPLSERDIKRNEEQVEEERKQDELYESRKFWGRDNRYLP